jgi:demethylmenaquinone methyltransferase/2-methoxy-6-polyprenyl-1,4-benzoquinol methylase
MGALYNLYFKHVLPLLGRILSRDPRAYAYLPESVARFPSPPRMMDMIAAAGFTAPTWTPYTFGIAGLYQAIKP